WNSYVNSTGLKSPAAGRDVTVSGWFSGAPDANGVWHNAGFYSYKLEWDGTNSVYLLKPTDSSEIKGTMRIEASGTSGDHYNGGLANSIYDTGGKADILLKSD